MLKPIENVTLTKKTKKLERFTKQAFDEAKCAICEDDVGTLVFCDKCDVAFHPQCYGIERVPEDAFVCRSCSATSIPQEPEIESLDMCFFEALSFFRAVEEFHQGTIPRSATDGEAMYSALSSSWNSPDANTLRDVHVALLQLCKEAGFKNVDQWRYFLRRRLSRDERTSHNLESYFFVCGGTSEEWDDLLTFLNDTSQEYFDLNFHVRSFILLHLCHDVLSVQKKMKKAIQRQRDFVGGFRPIGKDRLNRCVYFVEVGRGQFWVVRDALMLPKKTEQKERRVYQTFAFGGVGGIARAHDDEKYIVHFDDDGEDLELDFDELERILVKEQPRNVELVCKDEKNLRLYLETLKISKHRSELKIWHYLKTKCIPILDKAKELKVKFQKHRKRMIKMLGLNQTTIAACEKYEKEEFQSQLREEATASSMISSCSLITYARPSKKRSRKIDYSYTDFERAMEDAINSDSYYSK